MSTRLLFAPAMMFAALVLMGCSRHEDGHAHPHPPGQSGNHAHESAAPALETLSITHFSDRTELFVEFAPLFVAGESTFAAHLTGLADFKPVSAGALTVILAGGNAPEERFEVTGVDSPGIFKPTVIPAHAGERTLRIELASPELNAIHDLGKVNVYVDEATARKAHPPTPAAGGGIRFLKEQQWQLDFATAPLSARVIRRTVPTTATLRAPANDVTQITAPTGGQLAASGAMFPHVGMKVTRGQVLATLTPRLAADVDTATLRLDADRARLKLALAQAERTRLETLFKDEAVPERRVIGARNDEQIARAELSAAERRLSPFARGASEGGVVIRAPIAGTIADVSVVAGAFLNEGQPLFLIANTARLWLEARVAEADLARIPEPSGAWLHVPGRDAPIALEVGKGTRLVAFGTALDPITRTVPLILEFANASNYLRIGMSLRAEIWGEAARESLAVPAAAIVDEGGQNVVYVQTGGESFERRLVRPGARDGQWVELRDGVKVGERIVTRGAYSVRLAAAAPAAAGQGHSH